MKYIETPREIQLANCLRKNLEKGFPLYHPDHRVWAGEIKEAKQESIMYRTTKSNMDFEQTLLELNILYSEERPVGWIGLINLHESKIKDGSKSGRKLIECAESFFKEQGCQRVELTASGTNKGIWEHLGYIIINSNAPGELGKMGRRKELIL